MPEKTHFEGAFVFSCSDPLWNGWNGSGKQRKFELDRWAITQGRVKTLAIVDFFQKPLDAGAGVGQVAVFLAIVEWRGASQPRALPEPDVNLSIHPAPIIRPLVPSSNVRTVPDCGV